MDHLPMNTVGEWNEYFKNWKHGVVGSNLPPTTYVAGHGHPKREWSHIPIIMLAEVAHYGPCMTITSRGWLYIEFMG
jgi:hypothetical protein